MQPDPRSLRSIPCSGGPHSQHEQSQNEQFQFQLAGDLQVTDRWTYHPTGSAVSDTLLCQSMSVYLRKCADWLKVFWFFLHHKLSGNIKKFKSLNTNVIIFTEKRIVWKILHFVQRLSSSIQRIIAWYMFSMEIFFLLQRVLILVSKVHLQVI